MAIRWGIISAGKISEDFCIALSTLDPASHIKLAIAARDLTRAQQFSNKHNIKKAYGSYEELADDPEIDVVYIGALNVYHKEIATSMLLHNKHVLCEKPMCMNTRETIELIQLAREKRRFLMEAIWSRCFPVYKELRKALNDNIIGDVQHISVNFGFLINNVERLRRKDQGGGAILDLGVYVLQLQQLVFNNEYPESIDAVGDLNDEGIDECCTAILTYSGKRTAALSISSRAHYSNTAEICGTNGVIIIPDFWCPTQMHLPNGSKCFSLPDAQLKPNFKNSTGLIYEAEEVRRCLLAGELESPEVPLSDSIQLAEIRDQLHKILKVTFSTD